MSDVVSSMEQGHRTADRSNDIALSPMANTIPLSSTRILRFADIPGGYPQAAAFVNISPDFAVFRRFGDLQARLLLYRQAELEELESDLQKLDEEEEREKKGASLNSSWITDKRQKDPVRLEIVNEIRSSMKLYGEELVQYRQSLQLPPAAKWQIRDFKAWLAYHVPFCSAESHILDNERDLIGLRKGEGETGLLGKFWESHGHYMMWFTAAFKKRAKPTALANRGDPHIISYNTSWKTAFVQLLFAMLVSVLICAGVITLYFVHSGLGRLIVLCVATLFCATLLAVFTGASKGDVFGATAAYCAVLVVFVGSSNFGDSNTLGTASNTTSFANCTNAALESLGKCYQNGS